MDKWISRNGMIGLRCIMGCQCQDASEEGPKEQLNDEGEMKPDRDHY